MWSGLYAVENSSNLKALHFQRPTLKINHIKRNTFIWKWLCWVYLWWQTSWINIIENIVKEIFSGTRSQYGIWTYLKSFTCYSWNNYFHVVLKRNVLSISLQLIRQLPRKQRLGFCIIWHLFYLYIYCEQHNSINSKKRI